MKAIHKLFLSGSIFALCATPAFPGISISKPGNGAAVSSPFTLTARATSCSAQPVLVMGYSFDSNPSTRYSFGPSLNASVSAPAGGHTLHVKAWGWRGASCVADVSVNVQQNQNVVLAALTVPVWAVSVSNIQSLMDWSGTNDAASSGTSTGATSIVSSPSMFGNAREFDVNFTDSGDERFYDNFGDDATSTNFIYDGYVYLDSSSSQIGNLEFDLDQVMSNGQTVIFGVQCDGWNNTWDYTANLGTPTNWVVQWVHTPQPCNPRTWSTNTWHHIQIVYSRDDNGMVTYKLIALDGNAIPINATALSAFALGWGPALLTNFQIDGYGSSGSATVWLDGLNIYRW
ncbi:MAG TPA: hypothetical protein VHE33_18490 [Acidobacteriaceae bacterium]|nr:hypothetical protein [Acidobacteriaceae bacterium]